MPLPIAKLIASSEYIVTLRTTEADSPVKSAKPQISAKLHTSVNSRQPPENRRKGKSNPIIKA